MPAPLLALGPLAGIAAIIGGISASRQRREDELAAKQLEERRKVEMHEVESYASKGNHTLLQQAFDSGMYSSLPQDYKDRSIFRAGTLSNQQIALDAEAAARAGYQPYLGAPGQMHQAMQMLGQGGQGQPTQPQSQPTLPPGFADQAQAALPPGAPGQIAAQASTSPQIGAAPWQYPGTEQQGGAAPIAPPALSDGGQRMTSDAKQFTPIQAAQPQQFDYQGRAVPPQPQADLIPQPIRPEPVAMAERKQFGPSTTMDTARGLQWPKLTRPGKPAVEGPLGTVPGKGETQLSSGTVSQMMIGQADRLNMTPDEFERQYQDEAVKRKGDLPELDHQQLVDYRDRYFGRRQQQIIREIQSTSAGHAMDPALIQQSAARAASQEMGNYIPSKGGEAIGFTPEERHLSTVNQATGAAARELETAIRIQQAGGKYQPDFGTSFTDIIDNSPTLKPEEKSHIKQQFAQQIATRLAAKSDPNDPFGRMKAMLTAASMTGGAVPHEWQQLVMGDPKSFGMSQAMVDKYLTGKYNIFESGGYDRLANAVADDAIQGKLIDRALADPSHAEVYASAAERMKQQPMAGPGAPSTQSPLAGMGAQTRAIDVQQREAVAAAGVKGTNVEERRQVIESVAQPLSDLAKSMKRYMDIPLTNVTDSSNAAKLYSSQLKTMRSILAKGVLLQSGALNEQEQEAAMGALSGLIEAKAFPDVADEKIATLNRLMTKAFGKPVDLLADDPLNSQATPAIKVDKQGNIISGPQEFMDRLKGGQTPAAPSVSPPPPPPTPQPGMPQTAPAQMSSLPPLGTEIIGKTDEGRLIVKNPDGSVSTERSITEKIDGKWMNIPSMFGGKEVSPDQAVDIIRRNKGVDPETGRKLPTYDSMNEALKEAERRSREDLGKYGNISKPTIEDTAKSTKQQYPSESRPKFGPGSTKAAAATVPPEIQSALTHQDKVALANAMHKFGRGDIDDRQLELEVAKVLGRVGRGKLEGQALNKAVAAYTEILRRGTAAKQKAANGQ